MHLLHSFFTIFFLLHSGYCLFGFGFKQTVAIRGKLMCNGRPASGVVIKMYDNDLVFDSKMGETKTDSDGYFDLVGSGREISTVDAKVNFYHNCDNNSLRCKRKFTVKIPDSYVTSGDHPDKTYDFHQMEIAGKFPKESHDCLHRRR